MSTLVTNTITGLSTAANITIGSTPVVSASANSLTVRGEGSAQTSVQQGLAKCWTQIDGSGTIAARDSFNVTSLTDNGTGDYTITIANDMANDDYSVVSSASAAVDGTGSLGGSQHPRTYATGSFVIVTSTEGGSLADRPLINNAILGDLA